MKQEFKTISFIKYMEDGEEVKKIVKGNVETKTILATKEIIEDILNMSEIEKNILIDNNL